MKKNIICFTFSMLIIIGGLIAVRCFVKSKQEEDTPQIGKYYESSSEIRYSPGSPYNYVVGGEDIIVSGCTHKYVIDAEVDAGGMTFSIYYYDRANSKKGDLIRSEIITETGIHTYDLDDLSEGSYWFEIKENSKDTTANAKYKFCRERID